MPAIKPTERVKVTLGDGVERTLRYPLSAMKQAREEFGGSITSVDVLKGLDETNIGKLLWYGLKTDYPELTVEQIEDLVEPTMLAYLMSQYATAMGAAMPEPKNDQSPVDQEPTNRAEVLTMKSTGSLSGQSADMTSDSPTKNSGAAHSESFPHLQSATKTA
jgi:hypothetical protein